MAIDRLTCSVEEAADALGIGRTLVFDLVRSGELQSLKVGRRRLIPTAALDAWLATRMAIARSETSAVGNESGIETGLRPTDEKSASRLREVV